MVHYINWNVKVETTDGRYYRGKILAFDKFMNLCLGLLSPPDEPINNKSKGDAVEFRRLKKKKDGALREECRTLGFVLMRGEAVLSVLPETPPAPKHARAAPKEAPGLAAVAGRGLAPAAGPLGGLPLPMGPGASFGAPGTFGRVMG